MCPNICYIWTVTSNVVLQLLTYQVSDVASGSYQLISEIISSHMNFYEMRASISHQNQAKLYEIIISIWLL